MAGRESLELARQYRRRQLSLRAGFMRDFVDLWNILDQSRLNETLPAWMRLSIALIRLWRPRFAASAERYYRDARALDIDGSAPSAPPVEIETDRIVRNLYHSGVSHFMDSLDKGFSPEQARGKAFDMTQGVGALLAQEAGRETIEESIAQDRQAVGWMRITDGDPCHFCAMLAGRGAVYESEESALFDEVGEKYHPNCGCVAAPVFTTVVELPELNQRMKELWKSSTEGYSGKDARNAFRRAYEAQRRELLDELDEAA